MKRKPILFSALLTVLLLGSLTAASAYSATEAMLSPALPMLADSEVMIRSGLIASEITFSRDDFEKAVGCRVDSVTVTALPLPTDGTLYYGNAPVAANQTLSGASLGELRFVPEPGCTAGSFRFKAGGEYSQVCRLKFTDTVNLAPASGDALHAIPVFGADSLWTQQDVAVYGTLSGSDPEGDELRFEIVRYPEKGLLDLTGVHTGTYRYTPCDGMTGKDSFTYRVWDEWGNASAESTVSVDIDRAAAQLVFADMEDHWALNAALVMVNDHAMEAEAVDGALFFRPDQEVSREEFLVTVMKSLGAGEIAPCATVFADGDEISPEATGYIARAYELGVIRGSYEDGMLCFKPKESVTRAEAAVILNAILGAEEPEVVPVFADGSAVPAWAKGAMNALSAAGIFKGTGSGNLSPGEALNRAQTAQILLTIKRQYR